VEELTQWDKPAFKVVYLLNKLPSNTYVKDFNEYWKQWAEVDEEISGQQQTKPIIDRLVNKGLLKLHSNCGQNSKD